MVVDDEKDIVSILQSYLKKWHFETEGYTKPKEALDAFEKNPEKYDLVLTDVKMPDMTGVELAQRILKIKPEERIILSTAFVQPQDYLNSLGMALNPPKMLAKPFSLKLLCQSTRQHLQIQC